jgi:hypothetical protein
VAPQRGVFVLPAEQSTIAQQRDDVIHEELQTGRKDIRHEIEAVRRRAPRYGQPLASTPGRRTEDVDTQVEFTRDHDQSCLSAARGVINDLVHPDVNQELGCRQNDGRKPGSP